MRSRPKIMRAETWRRVEDLFNNTVDLAPDTRAVYLATHCDDKSVRQYVQQLIVQDQDYSGHIRRAIEAEALVLINHSVHPGQTLGAYKITEELQSGGMGTVFLAERADKAYRKQVAIKVLRNRLARNEDIQRFYNERQILADLEHANIARLLDGGTCEDGSPYLVMDYIRGETIDEYCRTQKLGLAERLGLFLDVCGALTYAHQHNIIHGDIKPGNILVADDATPKLLDFGIATLSGSPQPGTSVTQTEALQHLTPEYASPEQLDTKGITIRSDVYSLGVLLFKLLTDELPYRPQISALKEGQRQRYETRPLPVSVVKPSIINDESKVTGQQIDGELDEIIFKAMHKQPAERYATVELLADDIRRYLHHEPVLAHTPTSGYRIGKWLRRRRIVVGVIMLSFLSVVSVGLLLQKQISQQSLVRDILTAQGVTPAENNITVAVLPFSSAGNGHARIYAAGVTDQIITRLSTIKGLMIIAHTSVQAYAQASITRASVAQELGVRYLVYGALQQDGKVIRLQLKMLDAKTQQVVLNRDFDVQDNDLFNLHDRLLREILTTLLITPNTREQRLIAHRSTNNLAAYQAFVRGQELYSQRNKEANEHARHEFENATALDPGFARAMATLANTYRADYMNGWSATAGDSLLQAESLVRRALEMDSDIAQVHFVAALIQRAQKHHKLALSHAAEAIAINPNYADALTLMASILCYSGQPDNVFTLINRAQRLNPNYPVNYPFHSGVCYFTQQQYVAAANAFEAVLNRNPASQRATLWLSASHALNGNLDDARWQLTELLTWNPELSLSKVSDSIPYQHKQDLDRFLDGLRKAGMPE